jgi:hypothetical protein
MVHDIEILEPIIAIFGTLRDRLLEGTGSIE